MIKSAQEIPILKKPSYATNLNENLLANKKSRHWNTLEKQTTDYPNIAFKVESSNATLVFTRSSKILLATKFPKEETIEVGPFDITTLDIPKTVNHLNTWLQKQHHSITALQLIHAINRHRHNLTKPTI